MKAIQQSGFGELDVLKVVNTSKPSVEKGQILIKVKAAGVNPVDTYVRKGALDYKSMQFPITPGKDFAGIVEESSVETSSEYPIGSNVWVCMNGSFGGYAEYATATPGKDFIGKLPPSMTFEQGACVGVPYLTAYYALMKMANMKEGQTVFVHGASGGVGIAACNIASYMGCNVLASSGTDIGAVNAKASGAMSVFNHTEEGYEEKVKAAAEAYNGVDIVFDNAAHISLTRSMEICKPNGYVLVVGARGYHNTNVRLILSKQLIVRGIFLFKNSQNELEASTKEIEEMCFKGKVKPITVTYPLEDAAAAQHEVINPSTGGARGRIVLVP